ncbi:MAG: adenine deaminase [Candidatus Margulisbacteria bacterium]|nr:adenine deaminase [Candidatus Margulisiibacteriota bacterium]MBU1022294.1 adenine deaminase [Candidatus Margulisiibacteriota bacterium]MBU1729907.1 adenine deaminase [Candidatus Margulisiibacteriota bacterium]MBU1955940.1 adenine deaminase [Candidatus Margulisiibacteriota bacterium]
MRNLKEYIAVARGQKNADLLLKNCQLVNVFSGEVYSGNIAIYKDRVVGIGDYKANKVIDLNGKYVTPSFIDAHAHLESSYLNPAEFSNAALPHGTGAIIADPHEIANVFGVPGIKYMLEQSEGLPVEMNFMLPSCVPCSNFGTSGAKIDAADLKPLLKKSRVLGLAEMMNYPGVLRRNEVVMEKIDLVRDSGKCIDGRCPGLTGKDLSAYVAAGIDTEHEATTAAEAQEKLKDGMKILVREGSAAKNMEALIPAINAANSRNFMFCSDDIDVDDLIAGYMDKILAKAVALGVNPVIAIQMATLNVAEHYKLADVGAVAPGYYADLVVLDDITDFEVKTVIKRGEIVFDKGKVIKPAKAKPKAFVKDSVKIKPISVKDLKVKAKSNYIKVIEVVPAQITTKSRTVLVHEESGYALPDIGTDILKLAVVERHRATGRIGIGFVKGFGLKKGAVAQTIAHDSHNIICVGTNDEDMVSAIRRLEKIGGGIVVVLGGLVMAELPLVIGGLMSEEPAATVAAQLEKVEAATKELGAEIDRLCETLSFLALPVIPELRLTDKGLVDVVEFKLVKLFE